MVLACRVHSKAASRAAEHMVAVHMAAARMVAVRKVDARTPFQDKHLQQLFVLVELHQ